MLGMYFALYKVLCGNGQIGHGGQIRPLDGGLLYFPLYFRERPLAIFQEEAAAGEEEGERERQIDLK